MITLTILGYILLVAITLCCTVATTVVLLLWVVTAEDRLRLPISLLIVLLFTLWYYSITLWPPFHIAIT